MMSEKDLSMAAFVTAALDNDCPYIHIEFSGGGDSGDVDSTQLYPEECVEFDVDDNTVTIVPDYDEYKELMANKYASAPKITDKLATAFYEMFRGAVESHDWWNNDGGSGTLTINLKTKEYVINHSIYYQSSEDHADSGKFEF